MFDFRKMGVLYSVLIGLGGSGPSPVSAGITDVSHPAFDLKVIPMPDTYRTMGMGFLSDGRMVLGIAQLIPPYGDVPAASTGAKVLVVSGLTGSMANIQIKEIANNWMQITGITIANDKVYVTDRDGQYEILNIENPTDLKANRKKIVTWPDEGTWNRGRWWHQYVFTPLYWKDHFYAPYSGSIGFEGLSNVPPTSSKSGAFLKWDLQGNMEAVAGGLRSPNGLNISPTGDMMVTDNQGGWFPSSTFSLIKPGKFYGHRNTTPNFAENFPYQPPIAWLPHGDVRSSPTQPIHVPTGMYQGAWLMGDVFNPGLVRVMMDTVKGEYQGAVFWFSKGTGTAAINRLAWGPDGALYMGTIAHIGNMPEGDPTPMYKLSPKAGVKVFEMRNIRLLNDGFQIEFTAPVDKATIAAAAVTLSQWKYVRVQNYGEGRANDPSGSIAVTGTGISDDGMRIHIKVTKLTTDRVVYFKVAGIKSAAGEALYDNESWYTLNLTSDRIWNPSGSGLVPRPGAKAALPAYLHCRVAAAGLLEISSDLPGPSTLSLHTWDGTLVRDMTMKGSGPRFLASNGKGQGLYLLVMRHGSESYSQVIFF